MGRIITSVTIENVFDATKHLRCDALVDRGAAYMTLPMAWKERLGDLQSTQTVEVETATHAVIHGEICGPVKIQVEGFRTVSSEVLFIEMSPEDGTYEPLLGYIPLEQSQVAVDMLGHRLVPVRHVDLK